MKEVIDINRIFQFYSYEYNENDLENLDELLGKKYDCHMISSDTTDGLTVEYKFKTSVVHYHIDATREEPPEDEYVFEYDSYDIKDYLRKNGMVLNIKEIF